MFRNFFILYAPQYNSSEIEKILSTINFLNSFTSPANLCSKIKSICVLQEDDDLKKEIEHQILTAFDNEYLLEYINSVDKRINMYQLLAERIRVFDHNDSIDVIKFFSTALKIKQEELYINIAPYFKNKYNYYGIYNYHIIFSIINNLNKNVKFKIIEFILNNNLNDRIYQYMILHITSLEQKTHTYLFKKIKDNILIRVIDYIFCCDDHIARDYTTPMKKFIDNSNDLEYFINKLISSNFTLFTKKIISLNLKKNYNLTKEQIKKLDSLKLFEKIQLHDSKILV